MSGNLGELGEYARCAACIQRATRRHGIARLLGLGDGDGPDFSQPYQPFDMPAFPGTDSGSGSSSGSSGGDSYNYGINVDQAINKQYGSSSSSGGGLFSNLFTGAVQGAGGAGIDALKRYIDPGAYTGQMPKTGGGASSWLLPVGIGAGALVLILMLKGRRSAPQSA